MATGDDLLKVFEKLNVDIGDLNPSVINAWFDTDSETQNVLNWLCSSITEDNYVSPQENSEYSQIENILRDEELENETKSIEAEFPQLLDHDSNLLETKFSEDMIEVLEEQQNNCDHELKVNQQFNQHLSVEFSKISLDEIESNLKREAAQEKCLKLSNALDEMNSNSHLQILKYQSHVNNYENANIPNFINKMDIEEFEETFTDAATFVNSVAELEEEETSKAGSSVKVLSEMQTRLFHSKLSYVPEKMEVEELNRVLEFLNNYDVNSRLLFIDRGAIQLNVEGNKLRQHWMLKTVEDISLKTAEHYTSAPTLKFYEKELDFHKCSLNCLNQVKRSLVKVLSHLVIMYELYLQERLDIKDSQRIFTSIHEYVSKNLQNCIFRGDAMVKLIDENNKFNLNPIETRFKLIGNLGILLSNGDHQSLAGALQKTVLLKSEIEKLEIKHFGKIIKSGLEIISKRLIRNSQILQKILICGPTRQMIIIPELVREIDLNLSNQSSSVASVMQTIQKSKGKFAEDKWLQELHQLWIHFLTDPSKIMNMVEEGGCSVSRVMSKDMSEAMSQDMPKHM